MKNLVISTDQLNSAQICPRLYNFSHVERKTSLIKPAFFQEGELMHYMLKLAYTHILEKKKLTTEVMKYIKEMGRNYAAQKLTLTPDNVENVITDFEMHQNFYPPSGLTWKLEAVEDPFAKILTETGDYRIVVTGKADLRAITQNGTGPKVVIDHKYESQFRGVKERDNQPLCYCWAFDVKDFIFNRIGKQKSYKPEKRLKREWINYTKYQIEEWVEAATYTAMEIVKFAENNYWPARFTGCNIHGRKCTFHGVCNTTPDNREYVLDTLYSDKSSFNLMEDD